MFLFIFKKIISNHIISSNVSVFFVAIDTAAQTKYNNFKYNTLVAEQRNNEWIYYFYGVDGIAGFNYKNETYLYRKNLQGDVTHIYKQNEDTPLKFVAQYVYDAWGNYKVLQDTDGIGDFNPFRYRGYYFDEETGLYYLQTRYYDPELGRFISADSIEYLDSETIGGLNLYAYCGNNPIMQTDPTGTDGKWWEFWKWNAQDIATLFLNVAVAAFCIAAAVVTGGFLGIVLVGVGVGIATEGVLGAKTAYENGTDISAGIYGGAIKGAAIGLALGLGIITGTGALGLLGGFAAFAVATSANFLAGVAAYNVEYKLNGWETNTNDALDSGAIQSVLGILSFGAGLLIGASGHYNIPGKKGLTGLLKEIGTSFLQPKWIFNVIFGQLIKKIVYEPFKRLIDKNRRK